MRVDTPGQEPHDHGFGQGARHPELHELGLEGDPHGVGGDQHSVAEHVTVHEALGNLDHLTAGVVHGGHVEVGQLEHDFNTQHGLHGLDGLHDSVHNSIGLGFAGDEHHTLHDGLHHDPAHDAPHHDIHHDIGGLFH